MVGNAHRNAPPYEPAKVQEKGCKRNDASNPTTSFANNMNQAFYQFGLLVWLAAMAAALGCRDASTGAETAAESSAEEEEAPFDPSAVKMPADYREALVRIGGYRDQIRDAIAAKDLEKAHHPLDEADLVLNRLPEIARDSGVPRRHWEQVVVAAEDLNERLGELHAAIDAGQAPDYAALKQPIDDAIARLAAVSAQTSSSDKQAKK